MYSIRMRSAEGGCHEDGGRHISGAERLVSRENLQLIASQMIERALTHTKGEADFINIVIDKLNPEDIRKIKCLPIKSIATDDADSGRNFAKNVLRSTGITDIAINNVFDLLGKLQSSLRGAMIVDAKTGKRIDNYGSRGIRVSRMDIAEEKSFTKFLEKQGYDNLHIREALVLASKVVATPGIVAELCWSDDPEYTAGYVATKDCYTRFTNIKPLGNDIGGRVFFVDDVVIEDMIAFLEQQPVQIVFEETEL